jgi:predicted nucleic acid-binding protein
MTPLLLDSSVVVSAVLEKGLSAPARRAIAKSPTLLVSRLALVEVGRSLVRAEAEQRISGAQRTRVEHEVADLWQRCEVWEMSRTVCADASLLAPSTLRTLDAIHLATYLAARKRLPSLRLLTMDARMIDAARTLGIRLVDK